MNNKFNFNSLSLMFNEIQNIIRKIEFTKHDKKIINSDHFRFYLGKEILKRNKVILNDFSHNLYFQNACKIRNNISEREIRSWINSNNNKLEDIYIKFSRFGFKTLKGLLFYLEKTSSQNISKKNTKIIDTWNDRVSRDFRKNGFCVIPNVIAKKDCDTLRDTVLDLSHKEQQSGDAYLYGEDAKCQRIYNLINKNNIFSELIKNQSLLYIMDDLFNRDTLHQKFFLSSFHANILSPDSKSYKLHVDAAVPDPIPSWIIRANVNFITEDYSEFNGATMCVTGSHKFCKKPNRVSEKEHKMISIEAEKGSMVLWHGHLWHKSGTNYSKKPRVAILGCFAASFLLEMALEENHFLIDNKNLKKDELLNQLLGFSHGLKKGSDLF